MGETKISVQRLKSGAEEDLLSVGVERDALLALVEAVEAAAEFFERDSMANARALQDALARFDFGRDES